MAVRNWNHLGAFGAALLIGVGAMAARAKEDPATGTMASGIAVVDMERVYLASGGRTAAQQKMMEVGADAERRLGSIAAAPFLTPQERLEFVDLASVDKMDAAQEARAKELKEISDRRAEELRGLQVQPAAGLTAERKARIGELVEQQRALNQVMPGIQAAARMQQNEQVEAFRRSQIAKLRETVGQVAKQKGFAHVFDADALVYSANDLTPLALEKVGRRPNK